MENLFKKMSSIGLLIAFGMPSLAIASINYECRYDQSSILFEKLDDKDLIQLKDIGLIEEVGKPMIPVDLINLLIPQGQKADSVRVKINSFYTLPGSYEIKASPDPLDPSKNPIDLSIYNSKGPYPGIRAKIIRTGSFGGNRIVQIAVHPMDYFPKQGKIVFFTDLTIELFYGASRGMSIKQTYRTSYSDYIINKALKSIVDNEYDIPSYSYHPNIKDPNIKDKGEYSYIIITRESLEKGFEPLIDYLKKKGINARTFLVKEILEEYRGDPISRIFDDAGCIREFLMDMYKDGAQWVLLGGDENVVPVRYGTSIDNYQSVPQQQPSDLYYSDLDGNWNVDGDNCYGEPHEDSTDCLPELFVGRLPCDNLDEIASWFDKLVSYETNPGGGPGINYLTRVFWIGADQVRESPKYVIENAPFPSYFSHDTTMLESPDGYTPRGSEVIDRMNTYYGWFNFYGHGSPDQLTVSCPDNNHPDPERDFLVNLDSCEVHWERQHPNACRVEEGNGLDSLHNKDRYGIMYIASCYQGAYDFEHFDLFADYCGPSMAEAFTLLPERGGPAFLGYTRYATTYTPQLLHCRFFDMLFEDNLINIGVAEAMSKTQVSSHYMQLSHTLFGCPLMKVWTMLPYDLKVIVDDSIPPEVMNLNIRVTSNGRALENAYICLWKENEVYATGFSALDGNLSLPIEPKTEGEMLLTVTKENFLPYRDTIYITKNASITEEKPIAYATCKTEGTLFRNKVLFNLYLSKAGQVKLDIFDVTGRKVIKLIDEMVKKGNHRISWAGSDSNGGDIPEGIYFFCFQYNGQDLRGKFLFLR